MSATFDLERHRREKIRRLEREVEFLRAHRAQLERLVALLARCAVAGTGCQPLALVAVVERLDRLAQEPPLERLVALLEETAS